MYRKKPQTSDDSGYGSQNSSNERLNAPSSRGRTPSDRQNGQQDYYRDDRNGDQYRDRDRDRGYGNSDRGYSNSGRNYGNSSGYSDSNGDRGYGNDRGYSGNGGQQDQQRRYNERLGDYSYQQGRSRYDANRGGYDRQQNYDNSNRRRHEAEEEEYEYLRQETRNVQNDSLESTRRALSKLNETEDIARNNMDKLYSQSEQLHRIDRKLDSASSHLAVSDAKTDHLKSLNKSFLIPAWGSKKVARKEAELARQKQQQEQQTAEAAESYSARRNNFQNEYDNYSRNRQQERYYTTPNGVDRDDVEEELDRNLSDISSGLGRLKMMAMGMNSELDSQVGVMNRIADKSDTANDRLGRVQKKLDNIK